ncbi:serine/threonine protein kinase [Blastomyces percursus]|uniref:Serine/threonine protein kinase n=1 Tax=Blastomyces percursus TaxID=1658174 RepID=A0A1J9QCE6_9EURO|nr:serine/threonine protein kinase [Blastomyces percursus]
MVQTVDLVSYGEDESFLVYGEPEPRVRWQSLKVRIDCLAWWVRVKFAGTVLQLKRCERQQKLKRRNEFQQFLASIDYRSFSLLDNTVTEITLELSPKPVGLVKKLTQTSPNHENIFIQNAEYLTYEIREDPQRVIYPACSEFPSFCVFDFGMISQCTELVDGRVFRIRMSSKEDDDYIYKTVDRPFYNPTDTEVIREELKSLELVQNIPNIVQAAGVVASTNPYATSQHKDQPLVITGVLLKSYNGGSLQDLLSGGHLDGYNWQQLAIQIGTALIHLHCCGRTHMDIKPSNIVLDQDRNAILIDIGGMGVTYSWLAPEMQLEVSPITKPFRNRVLNDVWAYGKLLLEIAGHIGRNPLGTPLREAAEELMQEKPESRMSLAAATRRLRAYAQ